MVSKMISKSRLFVDILGPSPKEPSREAKWSPRGAKRLRKLIQKEVHKGSKWNINACILETVRSIFFVDGGQAEKDVGFSLKNRRLQRLIKRRLNLSVSVRCFFFVWRDLREKGCGLQRRVRKRCGLQPASQRLVYIYIYIYICTIRIHTKYAHTM